jgi:hypothetical protein
MIAFHYDGYAPRIEDILEAACNLVGEALLNLKSTGESVHNTGNLGEPDHLPIGNVGHIGNAIKGQHVVLAHTEKLDVFNGDNFIVLFREDGLIHQIIKVGAVPGCQKIEGFGHPHRGFQKTFSLGVLP